MGLPPTTPNLLRFGDYEFDPQAGELYKHGFRLRLQEQPLQVLLVLLANRGHVVTREELRSRLWPGTSAGDFDHGLNNAVNRLREMLCDSAEEPRFIETLPKRGYRFIATVEIPAPEAFPLSAPEPREASATVAPVTIVAPAKMASRWRRWWWAIAIIPLLLVTAWILRSTPRQTSVLPPAHVVQLTALPGLEDSPTWSPDGRFVAYVSDAAGNLDLYAQEVDGGQPIRLTDSDADDVQPAWSPDGRRIAFVSAREHPEKRIFSIIGTYGLEALFGLRNGDVWVMPAFGGPAKMLAPQAYYPAWSPDGKSIVYAATREGRWGLWIQEVDVASQSSSLAIGFPEQNDSLVIQPAWSPDGKWIAFVAGYGPVLRIFVVSSQGGQAQALTEADGIALMPSWSPDGRWLYFSSQRTGRVNLYKARFQDGRLESPLQLTTGNEWALQPRADSRGTRIAYSSVGAALDLWEFDLKARQLTRVTDETTLEDNARPSPDGTWLALASNRSGGNHLWLLNRRTGHLTQVTTNPNQSLQIPSRWSWDGRYLFYLRSGDGQSGDLLWRYELSTGTSRIVVERLGGFCVSTDDRHLILSFGQTLTRFELASGRMEVLGRAPGGSVGDLACSPDGGWVAFHVRQGDDRNLGVMPLTGGAARQLTFDENEDSHPAWSADSRFLYFVRNHQNIYVVPLAGGEPEPVTQYRSFSITPDYPATTADGKHLLFTRADKVGDIYVLEYPPQ